VGRLEGKVAVVTGSSGGIGRAIAEAFAAEGAAVVVNSRDRARADAVVAALADRGDTAIAFPADIREPEQVQAMAAAALEQFSRLDIWVNNAGVNVIRPAVELSVEDWKRVIDTNLNGCFYGSQAAARIMLAQKSGVIIQIGSVFGEVGLPTRTPYTTAKHGLVGMTKALAGEWAKDNVRVVCLEPGYIHAGLGLRGQELGAFTAEEIQGRTPMHRFGRPEELAAVAVFLASDEASFITGVAITVDGGWVSYGGW
jgi:3-oxoacyl-[acyl-carrier protein] reductase